MFSLFRRWRHNRIIKRSALTNDAWQQSFSQMPLLHSLSDADADRLKNLVILFLHKKSFTGAQGMRVSDEMKLLIAMQACLPILNLGLEWYRGWVSIIVYPDSFVPQTNYADDSGIVHRRQNVLSGESWLRGPVILSWQGVDRSGELDGSNLVIHEFVHKLDMLNGVANGFPPLHDDMSNREWSDNFSHAFDDFQGKLNAGKSTGIDSYAATSPAEFFAVLSEVFFERPDWIEEAYPKVYLQLVDFYRQTPFTRRE